MNINDLKHGRRYRLTRDVKNPWLDKRERYNPSLLAWTSRDVFRFERYDSHGALKALRIAATPRNPIGSVNHYHDGFAALVEALEELPESALDIIEAHGLSAEYSAGRVLNAVLPLLDRETFVRVVREVVAEISAENEP